MPKFSSSAAPHIHSGSSVSKEAWTFWLALLPINLGAIYLFKVRAFLIFTLAGLTALIFQWLFLRCFRAKGPFLDAQTLLLSTLFALLLPPDVSWTWAVIGSCFLVLLKQMQGGFGSYLMHPGLSAALMVLSLNPISLGNNHESLSWVDFIFRFSKHATILSEAHLLALFLSCLILVARKLLSWELPVFYMTAWLLTFVVGGHTLDPGLSLNAFFLSCFILSDGSTLPLSIKERRFLFFLTGLISGFFPSLLGMTAVVLISASLSPWLDLEALRPPARRKVS